MASVGYESQIPRTGEPAMLVRIFAWSMLFVLAAFLINNALVVGFDFPGIRDLPDGGAAWVSVALYVVAVALGVLVVVRSPDRALRWDAHLIHRFNIYLVRALFFAVLFVGLADVIIAFMRVENLLTNFMSVEAAREFGKASWVGTRVHLPLVALGFVVALFSRTLGFPWLALMIVAAELSIVVSRFVFSYEQALMADLVRYWYAALFLFAAAYTLYEDGHVRVDVLYAGFGRTARGYVNAFGSLILGMSTSWVILAIGFNGKQSIINSPVMNFEVTQSGAIGMFTKYQMAAFLGIFASTMLIQFVSYFLESVADFRDEPGHRDVAAGSAH